MRLALPHLNEHGWTAEILAVRAEDVEGVADPDLAAALPAGIVVHRVPAWSPRRTRAMGWGSLARRAYGNLKRKGDALLATGRFDLVFFSTTQFGVLPLGPYWKRRHGVPYVLDFQDEWVSSYYDEHPGIVPPGGRFKYGVARALARLQEPGVVREAAEIISVSPAYNLRLRTRHPRLEGGRMHGLPFGGAPEDFDRLARHPVAQTIFDPADGRRHAVCVGRGGDDMRRAAHAFFLALRRALDGGAIAPDEWRVHFIGTSYAPAARAKPSFLPLAEEHGLESMVTEHPGRIPYFTALQCLRDADALFVPGSDEAGYIASKIFPCLLARRPLLAVFHEGSGAVSILRETRAGTVVTFASETSPEEIAERIFREWWLPRAFEKIPETDPAAFGPHSAAEMTRRLAGIFSSAANKAPSIS